MSGSAERVRLHYVDFDGLRTGASFRDLPLARLGFSAARVELPAADSLVRLDRSEDYVSAVAAGLEEAPRALLGYCGGVEVARRLAVELAAAGEPPVLVVAIDPEPEDPAARAKQYALLLSQLGAEPDGAATLAQMRASLERCYDNFVLGLPETDRPLFIEERQPTLDRYVSWLGFVGAGSTAAATGDVPERVLLSRDVAAPAGEQPPEVVRVEAEQERLLASEEAAAALATMAWEAGLAMAEVANRGQR
jgi:hypothetical protein